MARPGHSTAWLPLLVLLFAAGAAAQSGCLSATFTGGRTFLKCNQLPVLGASLHWTYHAGNGTADIAYTIYATVALPGNATSHNTVWQAGPISGGRVSQHSISGPNVQSLQRLDFLSGTSTGASNSRLHRRNLHGVLNGVGWGVLIPLGAMIARYLRVFEAADPAWFYLHIACQISGYALGVAGWGLGLKLGSESKGLTYTTHRSIGIAIFCLATLQVFALFLRPDKKNKYRVYWNAYHHSVGYSVIVLAAVNIFKGLNILKPATGWKTSYVVILATLAGVVLLLEAITWAVVLRRRKRNRAHAGANGTGVQL
ncbi:unnamed protein product [Triticum turgidum subsp. durum]|uniref:Cytochrome b561 domain-containing protein n=1 Tax=Triticum turgidum subsp. durum TaxID=4567 RepID=A0A9R0VWD0_TRITD|nr:unnamed protein product [Triticum turgidum subsp. durum]